MEVSPELRLTPRSSGQLLWPDYLVPIDGRWPIHALPRTPLSRLVRPAQRAVAQRLRALARWRRRPRQPWRPVVLGSTCRRGDADRRGPRHATPASAIEVPATVSASPPIAPSRRLAANRPGAGTRYRSPFAQ